MRWFQGSIPAAIASAKQQTFIFVVVITGDDEQSAQLMSSWEDDTVHEAAQTCVAIKVDAKSDTCVQFSQIYPVVCIPSCFFIGENGIPLEVIAGSVSAEELTNRLDKVKQMHSLQVQGVGSPLEEPEVPMEASPSVGIPTEPALAPAPPTEPIISAPVELTTEEPAEERTQPASTPATPREPLTRSADEGASSSSGAATPGGEDRSASSDDTSNGSQPEENVEAKVERLTKTLEERREQKKKEEEEEQIKREMERRKVGKDMLDLKRKQEDDKTKRLLEERNREKAEEKAARDRVKAQIALDRADRAARYAKTQEELEATRQAAIQAKQAEMESCQNREKAARERVKQQIALDRADRAVRYSRNQEELEATRQATLQAKQAEMEARKEAMVRERSAIARIQFRLPDGSSFTNQFPSESRLQEARQFAVQEVGNRYGNFALATMFPRREFTGEDLNKTLLELELAPSASIVLLPQTGRPNNTVVQSTGEGGGFWALLGHILYPLLAVWRFLSGFLFASPPPAAGPQRPNAHPRPGSSAPSSEEPQRETSLRKRTLENRPDDFKKDGKIHRLRTQEDSEDENNTWNGNSTQQM